MNFSEYNWGFSKPKKSDATYDKKDDKGSLKSLSDSLGMGCIGMECCSDGMTYDSDINKCIPIATSSSSTIENFESYNYMYEQDATNVVTSL